MTAVSPTQSPVPQPLVFQGESTRRAMTAMSPWRLGERCSSEPEKVVRWLGGCTAWAMSPICATTRTLLCLISSCAVAMDVAQF